MVIQREVVGDVRNGIHSLLLWFLLLCAPLSFADVPAPLSQNLEPVRLQLKWLHQFQFAGYYAAVEQGYYRDAGFDVSLMEHPLKRSPLDVLVAGDADYVVMGSDLLVERAEGTPLVALAAITQHDPLALLVRKDAGIEHPQDLRGKRVMLDYGAHDASILAMLKKAGLSADDYQFQQTSYNPMDLAEGKTDAFNAYITDQGFLLDEQGIDNRYLHPSRYGIDFYSDILATTEQEIAQHPQRVARFREASLKGWAYAMANTEEVIDLILRKYNSQNRSRAHLQYEAAQMREMVQPLLVQLGYMHRDRWLHIRDTFSSLGFLEADMEVDTAFYQQEQRDQGAAWEEVILPVAGVMVLMGGVILLVSLWNRKLQQQVAKRTGQLEKANAHIEHILESMNEGLVVTDQENRIFRINRKLEKMTGRSHRELEGQPLESLFAEGGEQGRFDTQRTLKGDGEHLIPVQVSGAVLQHEEQLASGSVLVIHDLRDRIRAERQEQYAAFQAGVADMGASVLHNIGNVVTGMSGNVIRMGQNFRTLGKLAESLEKYLQEQLPSEKEIRSGEQGEAFMRQTRILQASSRTLSKLCDQVRDKDVLNKLEQGIHHVGDIISIQQSASRPIIHATRFTLGTMVEDTLNLIEDRLEKYEVELKLEMESKLRSVFLPRNPLMQLLLNLLKNSLEAIVDEMLRNDALIGKIDLSFCVIGGNQFQMEVVDNGCGFDPDRLEQLFQSGFTTKQRGSGYGLHSASTFIQSLKGDIWADSEGPHQGMRMVVVLPLEAEQKEYET